MSQTIVILGGGAIGSATAYFLTRDPTFTGKVIVLERDPTYKQASSALSASSIRQQFSTPLNIALSRFGFEFIQNAGTHLGIGDDRPTLSLHEGGYLVLASASGVELLRQIHDIQTSAQAPIAFLEADALKARFDWLNTDSIAAGTLGLAKEGWFDGYGLLQGLRKKAQMQGAVYISEEAVGFSRHHGKITAVKTKSGQTIDCDILVNACGPWSGKTGDMLGIDVPVRARRRSIFVFSCKTKLDHFPLLCDPSGVWVRPEGQFYIAGNSPKHNEADPDDLPLDVDYSQFEETIWPALAERIPAFENIKQTSAWAGYYEINPVDYNGLVGQHPAFDNLFLACGFSGHGLQHSPGIGRGLAELLVHGQYSSLDLSPLSYQRIVNNTPLREINII
eukprot:gene12293-12379_t